MANKKVLQLLIVFALAFSTLIALAHGSPLVMKQHIMEACMPAIKKKPPYEIPSEKCIGYLVDYNLKAVCGVINAEDETRISIERFVAIAQQFGAKLEPGTRCGTHYIVPNPPPGAHL
ncbi:hypothetical protein ACP4OV_030520 [Aristida adscensionis]